MIRPGGPRPLRCGNGLKLDIASSVAMGANERLIPGNGIVLSPSRVGEYGSTAELVAEVRQHLHRYARRDQ
jgi:hypothetical protein